MIKKTIFLFIAALAISCNHDDKPNTSGSFPVMTFTEKEYDFGTITQGEIVEHVFTFKNTGTSDLLISNAVGSCGCTIPEYPKESVKVGETQSIRVKFNSAGKSGHQTKTVTITANTATKTEKLTIKASINPAG